MYNFNSKIAYHYLLTMNQKSKFLKELEELRLNKGESKAALSYQFTLLRETREPFDKGW